jgi:DNA-binding NtrC family response regulator
VLRVEVPPLRVRIEDLPALVAELAPRLRRETGFPSVRLSADAEQALRSHDWPGNVRELHSTLARALLRAKGCEIRAAHVELSPAASTRSTGTHSLERDMVETALRESGGSVAEAAARIGWSRQKLYRRISALGIRRRG